MMKLLSFTAKHDSAIVNCIRQNESTDITISLYTYNRRTRSTMIATMWHNFNAPNKFRANLEQKPSFCGNYVSNEDKKGSNLEM